MDDDDDDDDDEDELEEMKMETRMSNVDRSREKTSGRNHFFFFCCLLPLLVSMCLSTRGSSGS